MTLQYCCCETHLVEPFCDCPFLSWSRGDVYESFLWYSRDASRCRHYGSASVFLNCCCYRSLAIPLSVCRFHAKRLANQDYGNGRLKRTIIKTAMWIQHVIEFPAKPWFLRISIPKMTSKLPGLYLHTSDFFRPAAGLCFSCQVMAAPLADASTIILDLGHYVMP
jgi:hypothetical protein